MSPTIHTTPSGGLLEARAALAKARAALARTEDAATAVYAEFTAANAALYAQRHAEELAVRDADVALRAVALAEFARLGIKKIATGVEIVTTKLYAVDEIAGLAWAREKKMCLIPESLDVKAVKKLATVQALPFVTVTDAPSVRIATELPADAGGTP